ncbi:MAG: hypothetical protein VB096_10395 [Pseudoflavonifractor sp.]|nr:hypothetical protein [Pseudoflavonifractor sp.]
MSFPNIPDVDPAIDIDSCHAINLLLASIAMEEVSLSKLMDAERDKIQYALASCKGGNCSLHDIAQVNKSADDMMKTMVKFQMLLQFKLENVHDLMPCTTTTSTTTTTTTSTTCTCSTSTYPSCTCCLMGTGKGYIQNHCDPLNDNPASIHAFLPYEDASSRAIRYTVGSKCEALSLYAAGQEVKADCAENVISIHGTGRLKCVSPENTPRSAKAAYTLTVRSVSFGQLEFRMQILSCWRPCFSHDSGFISVNDRTSDLRMESCC